MELWLDTIDVVTIRHAAELGILTGVTTNPALLSCANRNFESVIESIADSQSGKIAVQVVQHQYAAIMNQARKIAAINDRIVVKIPAVHDGFKAIAALERENITTLATAIFEPRQIILAALCNATYVAPYLNRIQMATGGAFEIIEKSQNIILKYGFKTKILSAAIKSVEQFTRCAELGVSAVTLPDDVYRALFDSNESITSSLRKFDLAWDANAGMNRSSFFALD